MDAFFNTCVCLIATNKAIAWHVAKNTAQAFSKKKLFEALILTLNFLIFINMYFKKDRFDSKV